MYMVNYLKKINAIQTVDTSNLIKKDHTRVSKTEVKVPNSTQKIKELSAEIFKERFKKADCVNKTDFCDKQILIKNLLQIKQDIQNFKRNQIIYQQKNTIFLLGRIYFIGDDAFQNIFIYQRTYNSLELK